MSSEKRTLRVTLAVKLFVTLVTFASLPGAVMAWWTLERMTESNLESRLAGLQAVADTKAESIDRFIEYRRGNVERIASVVAERVAELTAEIERSRTASPVEELPDLDDGEELADTPPAPSPAEASESESDPPEPNVDAAVADANTAVRRVLGLVLWDRSEFEELLVIGDEGRVLVSTYDGHEDRDASGVEYFAQGLRGTFTQPVFLSPITERHTMVVSTPIYSEDREVIAVLAARLNLDGFFGVITDASGQGETGETLTAEQVDGSIILRSPSRKHPDMGPGTELPNDDSSIASAARGDVGAGRTVDRDGTEVLAAWRHIDQLGWGLVVETEVDEALKPVAALRQTLWFVFLVVVVIAAVIAILLAGTIVRPLRQLRSAADRISRGDMGVSLDIDARDEVGELAESFERMIAAIRFFRERGQAPQSDDEMLREEIEREAAAQREEEGR